MPKKTIIYNCGSKTFLEYIFLTENIAWWQMYGPMSILIPETGTLGRYK